MSILKRIVMHLSVIKWMQIRLSGQRSHRTQDGVLKPLQGSKVNDNEHIQNNPDYRDVGG
jgi:hypothetical protein